MRSQGSGARRWAGLGTAMVLAATGCTAAAGQRGAPGALAPSTSAPATTSTAAPTTSTSTTTTTAPVPPAARIAAEGLSRGATGDAVLALEQRLIQLQIDPGTVDGVYDGSTLHGVMAFQKMEGLARTGRATPDVLDRLTAAQLPAPLMPDGGPDRVEIDLPRQVLMLYKGGLLFRVISVSTGSGKRYCVDGRCARAVTPGGSYRVSRRITGWRTSRLGRLHNPLYFNRGIAIHGSTSVPAYPASHGCVRVPMFVSAWLPAQIPNGMPVYVVGGVRAPVPFNEPAPPPGDGPDEAPPPAPAGSTSTSTSAPPPPHPATTTTTTTEPAPAPTTTSPVPLL